MRTKLFLVRKAALICVAFFVYSPSILSNQAIEETAIQKAHSLSQKGKRIQALLLLNKELKAGTSPKKKTAIQDIQNAIQQLSSIFLTEKAQNIFEKGESYYFLNKPEAGPLYEAVRTMEPGNGKVIAAHARYLLRRKKCEATEKLVSEGLKYNPYDLDLKELLVRALDCSGKTKLAQKSLEEFKDDFYLKAYFSGRWALAAGDLELAKEMALAVINKDKSFSEAHHLLWLVQTKSGESGSEAAIKYVSICKNSTPRLRRKYKNEPSLCEHLSKMEKHLEQGN